MDAWKRKLLDLSKRNRALNFRATKVSTIAIVEEHPAEIFRLLYLAEREMRFKAVEPAAVDATQPSATALPGTEAETEEAEAAGPLIKNAHAIVQVSVYDAVDFTNKKIEADAPA